MVCQTLYLERQVLAREQDDEFALDLGPDTLQAALSSGVAAGCTIAVVDAVQDYFACEVVRCDAHGMVVRFAGRGAGDGVPRVHLVLGLSNDEAMDTVIRQVSELGIEGVIPYRSRFSPSVAPGEAERLQGRWARLARYSARHAGLARSPEVAFIEDFEGVCETLAGFDAVLVCWEGEESRGISRAVGDLPLEEGPRTDIALVVGPRGGLAQEEVGAILAANANAATVSLGPAILRVETAGLVAPALLLEALRDRRWPAVP